MATHTPKNILIIEDEADIAQLVKLYLEKDGLRTAIAKTGAGAQHPGRGESAGD
jgi:DNA-binding response OmpR family regulator